MSAKTKICYFCGEFRSGYAWVRIVIEFNVIHKGYPCCNSCAFKAENVMDNMTGLSKRVSDLENELRSLIPPKESEADDDSYNPIPPNKIFTVKTKYIYKGKGKPLKFMSDDEESEAGE